MMYIFPFSKLKVLNPYGVCTTAAIKYVQCMYMMTYRYFMLQRILVLYFSISVNLQCKPRCYILGTVFYVSRIS